MHGGHVERIFAIANAQESGSLLEGLGPDAGNLHQLRARAEAAVLVAILHDVHRRALGDAGHVAQQRPRGGVQIDAHAVDAAFNHGLQRLLQVALIDIVLVLAHADRFGIDLHQLGERVLQAARNGDGAAHREVEIGKLLPGDIRGGVDAGAALADGHGENAVELALAQKLAHKLIGLASGGAVANGDGAHVVLRHQLLQNFGRLLQPALRGEGIHHVMGKKLAGLIDNRELAAGAQAGVDAQHGDRSGGRREQQVVQIVAEDRDGIGVGTLLQLKANFALNR